MLSNASKASILFLIGSAFAAPASYTVVRVEEVVVHYPIHITQYLTKATTIVIDDYTTKTVKAVPTTFIFDGTGTSTDWSTITETVFRTMTDITTATGAPFVKVILGPSSASTSTSTSTSISKSSTSTKSTSTSTTSTSTTSTTTSKSTAPASTANLQCAILGGQATSYGQSQVSGGTVTSAQQCKDLCTAAGSQCAVFRYIPGMSSCTVYSLPMSAGVAGARIGANPNWMNGQYYYDAGCPGNEPAAVPTPPTCNVYGTALKALTVARAPSAVPVSYSADQCKQQCYYFGDACLGYSCGSAGCYDGSTCTLYSAAPDGLVTAMDPSKAGGQYFYDFTCTVT